MKKILSILACVCVLLSVMVVGTVSAATAAAAGASETLSIAATTGVTGDRSISWAGESFTFMNEQHNSSNAIRVKDSDHFRCYQGSKTTITANSGKIAEIVITVTESKYVSALEGCTFSEGVSASANGNIVTLTVANGVEAVTIVANAQWRLSSVKVTMATDDNTGSGDNTGDDDTTSGVVDTVEAGKAYKFGMVQGKLNDGKVYYLTGAMSGYYMATTTDAAAAIDVYLEETTGGYYLYTTDGTTKTYINMVVSGTHVNGAYEASASTVYTYDAVAKTLVADVDGAPYWFGTRNDREYTTVGPCKTEYDGFYAQFYAVADDNTGSNDDSNKEENKPSSPVTGDTTNVLFVALGVISVAAVLLFASKKRALN
ncbi:MAG: LPXTG cell wall anchor domain-containing protein [Clostridia bacterium]|nr:LPXTG cell wall anchor domain-containing protein [Clostridia bacterium]